MCRPRTVRVSSSQVNRARRANTVTGIQTLSRITLKIGSETLIWALLVPTTACVQLSHKPRAKLRRPTSVARVAMNGGKRTAVISQVWSVPTRNPVTRAASTPTPTTAGPTALNAMISFGASASIVVAAIVPDSAIIEPDERSIPPAMITTVAPRAKIPRRAVLRRMSVRLCQGRRK